MSVRVLLDTTYARRAPYSGTAIYLEQLQRALALLDGIEIVPVANERRGAPAGGGAGSARNLIDDARWSAVELPRIARRADANVIHHPLPALAPLSRIPQVITVHDLAFERVPEAFSARFRAYARLAHKRAARSAGAVVCVSDTTAADAGELWRVEHGRIVVAPLGPGQELPELHRGEPRHFLYVGDGEPRKNLGVLLRAYGLYRERTERPLELVLAGSASATGPGITIEHRPEGQRLAQLYADSLALVHPSLYEGFGLTALEAMKLGVPVLAATSPGIVEVCGDAARYAAPHDPESFAAALAELQREPALARTLGDLGRARAARFSWESCARAHADAYSLAIGVTA